VAEGIILADRRDSFVTLFQGPVAEWVREGAGAVAGHTDHVLDALTLRQVVGGDDRNEIRGAGPLDVIGDGQTGVGEQIAYQHMAIALLDQTAGLLQRGVGIGCVVLDRQFDFAAGDLTLDLIEVELHAFDHFFPAGSNHTGQRRHQTDLDGGSIGIRGTPGCDAGACSGQHRRGSLQKLPTVHFKHPFAE